MRRILIVVVLFALLHVLTGWRNRPGVGQAARDFTAVDLEGNQIALSKYRGKVVLIVFWATWCPSCIDEQPHEKALYEKHKDEGFEIIGVSLDADRGKLEEFVRTAELTWPQICDGKGPEGELAKLYRVRAIVPKSFLIDHTGTIRYRDLRHNRLGDAVKRLLSEAGKGNRPHAPGEGDPTAGKSYHAD